MTEAMSITFSLCFSGDTVTALCESKGVYTTASADAMYPDLPRDALRYLQNASAWDDATRAQIEATLLVGAEDIVAHLVEIGLRNTDDMTEALGAARGGNEGDVVR